MNAYFDTSGLLKLLVAEPGSDLAMAIWESTGVAVTSRVTYVEARAALAAARRQGRLADAQLAETRRSLEARFQAMEVVEVDATIARAAGDIAEQSRLRGYDAIHLASSLMLGPEDTVLVTWDRDLAWAAYAAGLSLAGISLE